jgi:hypothetical protein
LIAAVAGMSIAIGANWSKIKRLLGKKKKETETSDEDADEKHPDA